MIKNGIFSPKYNLKDRRTQSQATPYPILGCLLRQAPTHISEFQNVKGGIFKSIEMF